jgi:hypothetical protein
MRPDDHDFPQEAFRGFAEEVRTRGKASLALSKFAFAGYCKTFIGAIEIRQFGDVPKPELV